jgi:hypothetical protein
VYFPLGNAFKFSVDWQQIHDGSRFFKIKEFGEFHPDKAQYNPFP